MRKIEAWAYAGTGTVFLTAGALCLLISIAIGSFALGALGITILVSVIAMLPAYRRFEIAWLLFLSGGLLYAGTMMVVTAIPYSSLLVFMFGVGALIISYYIFRPVVRQLEATSLPRFLWWIRHRIPVEQQLLELAKCEIRLRPEFTVDDLPEHWPRRYLETHPYAGLLYAVGSNHDDAPYANLSDDVWVFDTECIVETGDYAHVAEGYRDLAKGDLPIEDIEDHVDIEAGEAWLAFTLDGRRYRWQAKVESDWIDVNIWQGLEELLDKRGTGRQFYSLYGFGQSWPIVCLTKQQAEHLKSLGIPLI